MAGAPNPAMLAALSGAGPGPPPGMPPPPGVPPPGAAGAGANPPGVGPAGPGGGMSAQLMLLSFLAGAGLDKIVASIDKLRGTAGGRKGASKDAANAPGMTIPPQMAQMIAQNPGMAARLMQLVKSQLGGGMPTPGGGV